MSNDKCHSFLALKIAKTLGASGTYLIKSPEVNSNDSKSEKEKTEYVGNAEKEMSRKIGKLFSRSTLADATIDCCGAASRSQRSVLCKKKSHSNKTNI